MLGAFGQRAGAAGSDEVSSSMASIRAAIGTAPCTSDSQCRMLPVGSRACGGPDAFLAWSTVNADARELARLAASYPSSRSLPGGRFSTCVVLVDPGAACVLPSTRGVATAASAPSVGQCRVVARPAGAISDR